MFWCFGHKACGILAPQSGIKPIPPTLEGKVLTTRLLRKACVLNLNKSITHAGALGHMQNQKGRFFAFIGFCVNFLLKEAQAWQNQLILPHLGRKCHRITMAFHSNLIVIAGFPVQGKSIDGKSVAISGVYYADDVRLCMVESQILVAFQCLVFYPCDPESHAWYKRV